MPPSIASAIKSLPHVHRQRERLHHKIVAVPVDDQPGKSVAFAPNNAAKPWIEMSPRTVFCRLCDSAFEEIQIQVLFPSRETARHNLRLGIVNRATDQMILTVLERDDVSVCRFPERPSGLRSKTPNRVRAKFAPAV